MRVGLGIGTAYSKGRAGTVSPAPVLSGTFDDVQTGTAYNDGVAITGTSPFSPVLVTGALPPSLSLIISGSNLVISGLEN